MRLVIIILLAFIIMTYGIQVNYKESWSNGTVNGWVDTANNIPLTNPTNYLQLSFPAQSILMPAEDRIIATTNASNGAFSGDYTGVSNITFSLMSDGHISSGIRLILVGSTGRQWTYGPLSLSGIAGQWTFNSVPLEYSSSWSIGGPGSSKQKFQEDITNITMIGIQVSQSGTEAQIYAITDFCIHGTTNSVLILGNGPASGSSVSQIRVSNNAKSNNGVALGWTGIQGRKYSVYRSTDLMQGNKGFSLLRSGIDATLPDTIFEDDTVTGNGPYFYKIVIE